MILLLALAAVTAVSVRAYARLRGAPEVHVRSDQGEWIYPLDAVRSLTVAGPLGPTVLRIAGGEVRVVSSPCAEQTCVRAGPVSQAGQWIACLPNRVFVTVEGRTPGAPDAVSR